jgi:tyrosinase
MGHSVTRRRLLQGGAAGLAAGLIPFPEWFARYSRADATPPLVRYNVKSAAGAAMLAKYSTAVDAMTKRGKGDPCSWIFQWYTHQIRSDLDKATEILTLPSAQRPLATEMWNTCQAHGAGRPLQFFLPWHRMYVYFLERIVRQACGDPAFTLPYWDYFDPTQRPIPPGFQSATANPLYRPDRNNGSPGTANVNGGQPIDFGAPAGAISQACLKEANYPESSPGAGDGLCAMINQNPHGVVHGMIGNLVGMGRVPWAANDPVFWLHHCNIDRLWASWNNRGGTNPATAAWRDQQFVFADENCNRVQVKVSDFEAIAPLGYAYDRLVPSVRVPPYLRLQLIAVYRRPDPDPGPLRLALADRPVTIRLAAPAGPRALSVGLRALPSARNIRLTVRDLQATAAPGILYHLYLNLPAGASRAVAEAHYIGPITFFDAVTADRAQMAGMDHGPAAAAASGPSFSFDVTALVRRLGRPDRLEVTLVPQGRPAAGANAVIGNVELSAG